MLAGIEKEEIELSGITRTILDRLAQSLDDTLCHFNRRVVPSFAQTP